MILAALLLASAPPGDTITVTGRKAEDVRREAQTFVRATGVADEPVARWIDPVCPQVIGVAPDIAARVERRIQAVAQDAGARVGKAKCRSNLLIAFVQKGEDVVRKVAARSPHQFKDVDPAHRRELYEGAAPIRWWHAIQARTRDNMRSIGNEAPPSARLDGPGGVPIAGDMQMQYSSSIVGTQMVRALQVATVIIDVDKATGQTLDSVTDFAALVGLAEIRPTDPPPGNSVLGLFSADGAKELTVLDSKFLATIYKLPLDRTAFAHRSMLVRGLIASESAEP